MREQLGQLCLETNSQAGPPRRHCSRYRIKLKKWLLLLSPTLLSLTLILASFTETSKTNNAFQPKLLIKSQPELEPASSADLMALLDYERTQAKNEERNVKESSGEIYPKIRSSRKSHPGMINGDSSASSSSTRTRKPTEGKQESRPQLQQQQHSPSSVATQTGAQTMERLVDGQIADQGGDVIDIKHSVSQYEPVGALDSLEDPSGAPQTLDFSLAGLEVESNTGNTGNKEEEGQTMENSYNDNYNDDDNDSKHSYVAAASTRRKRYQDSDRLQISDFNNENSENSEFPSLAAIEKNKFVADLDFEGAQARAKAEVGVGVGVGVEAGATVASSGNSGTPTSGTPKPNTDKLKCRVERNLYLNLETYKHYSCANCYTGMPKLLFLRKLSKPKEPRSIWLFDELNNRTLLPNETETIRSSFKSESTFEKWQECCSKAIECCLQNSIYLPKTVGNDGQLIDEEARDKCHATWDGLGCWPDSPAGKLARRDCPDHAYVLEFVPICRGQATKQCFPNGSWFIRYDHEWSDYSQCAGEAIYGTRLLIASVWHLLSVIIIGPSLVVLKKLPNRGGSKRVRILSNLLFWLLLNGLLAATYKIGIIGGVFQRTEANPEELQQSSNNASTRLARAIQALDISKPKQLLTTPSSSSHLYSDQEGPKKNNHKQNNYLSCQEQEYFDLWRQRLQRSQYSCFLDDPDDYIVADINDHDHHNEHNEHFHNREASVSYDGHDEANNSFKPVPKKGRTREVVGGVKEELHDNNALSMPTLKEQPYNKQDTLPLLDNYYDAEETHNATLSDFITISPKVEKRKRQQNQPTISELYSQQDINEAATSTSTSSSAPAPPTLALESSSTQPSSFSSINSKSLPDLARLKRSARSRKKQHPTVVFVCWFFTVGIRITRLLGYAWMFTGAVYLCSVLHFAPAEPPASFIKWLMYLTNGFPVVIGLTYIIARTIYEPSPLNILVKVPYYYLTGDIEQVDHLMTTQLACWTVQSKYDYIEEIADAPNYVLVILNGVLFVVTLIIMCRITRPGSTRPEMSPGDYFKAAGTLVLLYGAHYALLAYRPPEESCIIGQLMHYSFLFVDGIQGIAVSYVFCYRTSEGKEIIHKWFIRLRESNRLHCCGFRGKKHDQIIASREHGILRSSNKSNQSTRSTNSVCNGNDPATEFININSSSNNNNNNNNSRAASQF